MKITLKHRINALLSSEWWMLSGTYNKSFDKWLLESINNRMLFYNITGVTACINGQKLWIANHPYYSFRLATDKIGINNRRPSKTTILLAKDWLDYCIFEEELSLSGGEE
jgi:hypothetical protein